MRNLFLFVLILQFVLSGCSPDGGFLISPSVSKSVINTDSRLNPDNELVISPRGTKENPRPQKHHLGYVQVINGKLTRREDQSFLFAAKVVLLSKNKTARWVKDVELEGRLNDQSRADLYPVKGDVAGENPVRARMVCLDHMTCTESILDVFVKADEKVYAAQVQVTMETQEETQETPETPETIEKNDPAAKNPTAQQTQPAPNFSYPQRPVTKTPLKSADRPHSQKKGPSPQRPVSQTPPSAQKDKKDFKYPERPVTRTPVKTTAGSKPAFDSSKGPRQPPTVAEDNLILQQPGKDPALSADLRTKFPELASPKARKPNLLQRLFGSKADTENLNPKSKNSEKPQKPQLSAAQILSQKAAAAKAEKNQIEKSKPQGLMTKAPTALKTPPSEDGGKGPAQGQTQPPTQRPPGRPFVRPSTPSLPAPSAAEDAPKIDTDSRASNTPGADKPDSSADHDDDLEEGAEEHEHQTEEDPSIYIGTLHEPTEDLFATDRPPVSNERPEPRPERDDDLGDQVEGANKGTRPKDQVVGQTSCWTNADKAAGRKSCGSLEKASDLSTLKDKKFKLNNLGRKRFYGSHELVTVIKYLAEYYDKVPAFGTMNVNDLSQRSGGRLINSDHKSHQNGLDVDVSYPVGPKGRPFTNFIDKDGNATQGFKVRETWAVFKAAWSTEAVDRIFVNNGIRVALCREARRNGELKKYEQLLKRIRSEAGHQSHYHLRVKCTPEQPRCRTMGDPGVVGSGC